MATAADAFRDPGFRALPRGQQLGLLAELEPDFGRLPQAQREQLLDEGLGAHGGSQSRTDARSEPSRMGFVESIPAAAKATLAEPARGFARGAAHVAYELPAQALGAIRNLPSLAVPGAPPLPVEGAQRWLRERAKASEAQAEEWLGQPAQGFVPEVLRVGGEAAAALPVYGGAAAKLGAPVAFAGLGALQGETPAERVTGAVTGLATGRAMELGGRLLPRYQRVPAMGALFGGQTLAAGGTPEEAAVQAVVGGGLGVLGPRDPRPRPFDVPHPGREPLLRAAGLEPEPVERGPLRARIALAADRFRQAAIDDLQGLFVAEKAIRRGEAAGPAFRGAANLRGLAEVQDRLYDRGYPVWTPEGRVTFEGKGLRDILAPVARSASEERDTLAYFVARQMRSIRAQRGTTKRIPSEPIGPKGTVGGPQREPTTTEPFGERFTMQELDRMIGYGESLATPARVQAFDELVAFRKKAADFAQRAGLFTPESRELWNRGQYAFAFRRQMGEAVRERAVGGTALRSTSGIRHFEGSELSLRDPAEQILEGPARLIQLALENRVRQRIGRLAAQPGAEVFLEPLSPKTELVKVSRDHLRETIAREAKAQGVELEPAMLDDPALPEVFKLWFGGRAPTDENVMTVLEGGKPRYFKLNDELLARAVGNLRRKPIQSTVLRFLNGYRSFKQSLITLDPRFMYANAIRDPLNAWAMTRTGRGLLPMYRDAFRGMWSALRQDSNWLEAMANGMGGSTIREPMRNRNLRLYAIRKHGFDPNNLILEPADVGRALGMIAKAPFAGLNRLGRAIEIGTRLGEFERARALGKSAPEAAYMGREITTDFSRKGDSGTARFLGETIPFFNAAVASADRFYRGAIKGDPLKARMATAARIGMVPLYSMALYGLNRALSTSAPDQVDYNRLPDWDKRMNWHYYIPGPDGGFVHLKQPKIWEIGSIASSSEVLLEHLLDSENLEDRRLGVELLETLGQTFGVGMPVIAEEIAEQWANKVRFTGQPIEPRSVEGLAPFRRATEKTPATLTGIAEKTRNVPLLREVSPARADSLLRAIFGTWAVYGLRLTDGVLYPGEPKEPWAETLASRLYERPKKYNRYVEAFYQLLDEADETGKTISRLEEQGRYDLADQLELEEPTSFFATELRRVARAASAYRDEVDLVRQDQTLSADEKRRQIDALIQERNRMLEEVFVETKRDIKAMRRSGER